MAGSSFGKSPEGFHIHGTSLEPIGMDLGSTATPSESFFVCSAGDAPLVDADQWRIEIAGTGANETAAVRLADLSALPKRQVQAWLECAGNGRRLYELVDGYQPSTDQADTPWTLGAMAIGEWSGPRLADVLACAGVTADAAWVAALGADVVNTEGEPIQMCLPLDKALDDDTIVATELDGEPLSPAHGYPARLIVPGWVGAYSIKWLARLEISNRWIPSWRADSYYRLRSADGTDLGPATAHPVKSTLALTWDATLDPGPQTLSGYARSGAGEIATVEYSIDDGPWLEATLASSMGRWAWRVFTIDCDLDPGQHQIRTRATDATRACQPERVAYHPNTLLWNATTAHPVVVGPAS